MCSTVSYQSNLLAAQVLEEVKDVKLFVQEALLLFSNGNSPNNNNTHDEIHLDDRANFVGN